MTELLAFINWVDARIWQALIAALVVMSGWLVNGWRNRRSERRLRRARVRDVQKALYAEIRAYLTVLERDRLDIYGANLARRIVEGGDGAAKFVPFIPTERNTIVFEAIVAEIHVLPRATIDPVVLYYSQLEAISALIGDLRSPAYAEMGAKRRAQMYLDYISLKQEALALGHDALEAIEMYDVFGEGGVSAWEEYVAREERDRLAEDVRKWVEDRREAISSRGAGPSGQ